MLVASRAATSDAIVCLWTKTKGTKLVHGKRDSIPFERRARCTSYQHGRFSRIYHGRLVELRRGRCDARRLGRR
eukprot:4578107-Pyramimonas_sp.AAC.1